MKNLQNLQEISKNDLLIVPIRPKTSPEVDDWSNIFDKKFIHKQKKTNTHYIVKQIHFTLRSESI